MHNMSVYKQKQVDNTAHLYQPLKIAYSFTNFTTCLSTPFIVST